MPREIKLTRGFVAIVDEDDYAELNRFKWYVARSGLGRNYAHRMSSANGKRLCISMHRSIARPPRGKIIDHIDGDGLNNTRANLRFCTASQNNRNRIKRAACHSRFKGVTWKADAKLWFAQIASDKVKYNIGYFKDEIEAARAYDKEALRLHKDFARINFPHEHGK